MIVTECPSHAELLSFNLGKALEDEAERIAAHLDSCPECQAKLDTMSGGGDTLVSEVRRPTEAAPFRDEPELADALARVAAIGRDPSFATGEDAESAGDRLPVEQLGQYRLLKKLGEGGMGAVYKALHLRLEKVVALKVMARERMQNRDSLARFEREMKAVGRLAHPHIVQAHDAGECDGTHFLVMEYVDGVDLSELARKLGRLPIAAACEIVRQAALGLEHVRKHGLVHRDIKPSNLMLTADGQVKILDLGLALLQDQQTVAHELTTAGQMMGTIDYMAPEQGGDSHEVDIRADIYSLGATLYKLLAGQAPFADKKHDTPVKRIVALATEPVPPLAQHRPDAPAALLATLDRMLAKLPGDRYQTPAEVAAALAPLAANVDLAALLAESVLKSGDVLESRRAIESGSAMPAVDSSEPATRSLAASASDDTTASRPSPASAAGGPPRRTGRRALAAAAGFFFAAAAVWLIVRDKDGKEVARLQVPEGSTAEVENSAPPAPPAAIKLPPTGVTTPAAEAKPPAPAADSKPPAAGHDEKPAMASAKPRADAALAAPVAADIAAPVAVAKPFRLIRDGKVARESATFGGVYFRPRPGDIIEIAGPGPYALPWPLKAEGIGLHIRAAKGFRPRIVRSDQLEVAKPSDVDWPSWIVASGGVRFEGLDIESQFPQPNDLIKVAGGPCDIVNCRIVGGKGGGYCNIISFDGDRLSITDSLIFGSATVVRLGPSAELDAKNSIVYAGGIVFGLQFKGQKLSIRGTTLSTKGNLCRIWGAEDGNQPVSIFAERTIFAERDGPLLSLGDSFHDDMRKLVQFEGKSNIYVCGPTHPYARIDGAHGGMAAETFDQWREFTGSDADSIATPDLRFAWEMSDGKLDDEALRFIERAFRRLADRNPDRAAPGFDGSIVGVGDAYVRALAVAGDERAQAANLRPDVLGNGPFTLLTPGESPRGFSSLDAAVEATRDGDIVEIRADDDCGDLERSNVERKPKQFTLRAGAGYQPALGRLRLHPADVVRIEGLMLKIVDQEADPGKTGRVERIANCWFRNTTLGRSDPGPTWTARFTRGGTADQPIEIVNSYLGAPFRAMPPGDRRLRIENSVLGAVELQGYYGSEVASWRSDWEINRSVVWIPAAVTDNSNRLLSTPFKQDVDWFELHLTANHSLLAGMGDMLTPPGNAGKIIWQGDDNLFTTANGRLAEQDDRLEDWQAHHQSDNHSLLLDAPQMLPTLWRVVRGAPRIAEEKIGADVDHLLIDSPLDLAGQP